MEERFDKRFIDLEHRIDRLEREQTRLRTDFVAQAERVLDAVATQKEDLTVAMAYAGRPDTATGATAIAQRALQS